MYQCIIIGTYYLPTILYFTLSALFFSLLLAHLQLNKFDFSRTNYLLLTFILQTILYYSDLLLPYLKVECKNIIYILESRAPPLAPYPWLQIILVYTFINRHVIFKANYEHFKIGLFIIPISYYLPSYNLQLILKYQ